MKQAVRLVLVATVAVLGVLAPGGTSVRADPLQPAAVGGLDCNGYSPIQKTLLPPLACSDVRGFANVSNAYTWGGRFYDNGHYIGHDEPTMAFLSHRPGSGNNVSWTETLPVDPVAPPTVSTPGSDVTHYVELSPAPWFGMDLCDPSSYPQLPCTPNSDANAPDACTIAANPCPNGYVGGGSAFLEMQFYPPGEGPFPDNISCDNTHWCASLHINEAECTYGFATCNPQCVETTNFAFVQRDGIPTGPPSPQLMNLSTATPNGETLLMNPGDTLQIHIGDAPAPGGGNALEVAIDDLTTGQSGSMQASAANGFARTSLVNCNGTLFNFEPEYQTAAPQNIVPWAAIRADISSAVETGHFEPCTSVSGVIFDGAGGPADPIYNSCTGPYEAGSDSGTPEGGNEAVCYPAGDTHGTLDSPPNIVTGCQDNIFVNGDLDFDGTPYWPDWPTGASVTALHPASFAQSPPTSNGSGYAQFFFQTDTALSEATCSFSTPSECAVPPPGAPGNFYPYWSLAKSQGRCLIEFGNVSTGSGVNTFGGDAEYGINQGATLGYPELVGKSLGNTCAS